MDEWVRMQLNKKTGKPKFRKRYYWAYLELLQVAT
jgi:hypothetical protein